MPQPVVGDLALFVALAHGGFRGAVRHPPHRRHRASGRPHAGDRGPKSLGEAARLPDGRRLRHLLHARRAGRAVPARDGEAPLQPCSPAARVAHAHHHDAPRHRSPSSCCRASSTSRWSRTAAKRIRRAAWLFPLYLVLINLFVVPIAIAGLLSSGTAGHRQRHVRARPAAHGGLGAAALSPSSAVSRRRPPWSSWKRSRSPSCSRTTSSCRSCCSGARRSSRAAPCRRAAARCARCTIVVCLVLGLCCITAPPASPACGDRPPLLRRRRATRAGVLRRADLA